MFFTSWVALMASGAFAQEFVVPLPIGLHKPAEADRIEHPLVVYRQQLVELGAREGLSQEQLVDRLEIWFAGGEDEDGKETAALGVTVGDWVPSATVHSSPDDAPLRYYAPEILQLLETGAAADDLVDVRIGVDRSGEDEMLIWDRYLMLRMLDGTVETWGDAKRARVDLGAAKTQSGVSALEPLLEDLEESGAVIVDVAPMGATVRARVDHSLLRAIVYRPDVRSVSLASEEVGDVGLWTPTDGPLITGLELEDEMQSVQYYQSGYAGAHALALVEPGAEGVFRRHPGFKTGPPYVFSRHINCPSDSGGSCTNPDPDEGWDHATAGASILIGDITLGQDSGVSGDTDRRRRSGVAREAWSVGLTSSDYGFMSDVILAEEVHIVSNASSDDEDPDCLGQSTRAATVNDLYEVGVAFFKSAGNAGNGDTSDCTLGDPAAAIGAFAVGASYLNGPTGTLSTYGGQSRGGTSTQGIRSIVGLQGFGRLEFPYPWKFGILNPQGAPIMYGTEWVGTSTPPPEDFCCTSSATPTVAGAAELYQQWKENTGDPMWSSPGSTYAALLLMGDRYDEAGGYRTSGYSNLTGGGRLRLRRFDAAGVDGPSGYGFGNVCVYNGQSVTITLNGGAAIPTAADTVKGVIWWYDPRHETHGELDDIRLALDRKDGPITWTWLVRSGAADNKQMVYRNLTSSDYKPLRLKITGTQVANSAGCLNGTRVYYAYLWEDDARDDPEPEMDWVRPQ